MTDHEQAKAAFITGASKSIGAATSIELAKLGFNIALNYRDENQRKRVRDIADQIKAQGREVISFMGDVTNEANLTVISNELASWYPLKALVLNAAELAIKQQISNQDYPIRKNSDAILNLLSQLTRCLAPSSCIVYIANTPAEEYDGIELSRVKFSKFPTSKLIEKTKDSLPTISSRLIVLTTGQKNNIFHEDTALKKYYDLTSKRPEIGAHEPVQEVGEKIARAIENPMLASDHTEWVGADEVTFYVRDIT